MRDFTSPHENPACRFAHAGYLLLTARTPTTVARSTATCAAALCCSICGPPGACRAARRCRRSMALQAKLGGGTFEVVAVNIDPRDPDKPRNWLRDVGITRLAYYADPSAKVFQDLKLVGRAFGMPTTLMVDPAGCEFGTVAGPAAWSSEDALKLVTAAR